MAQETEETPRFEELTYEEWREINDKLDAIQERLNKLCGVLEADKTPTSKKDEDKK